MAEIRVVREGGGARRWLWLLPLVLLLAAGAYFLFGRSGAQEQTAARTDTTTAVSTGALDTAAAATAGTPAATPMAPSPVQVGDTAPGAPPTERAGEASRAGAAGVAAPGPGPRTP